MEQPWVRNCAVNYAFLYIGLLEMVGLIKEFEPWMSFYQRSIDDGIGIWLTNQPGSVLAWEAFLKISTTGVN